jgi:cation diffusion facilitator CzcD-associated flavoprotein CzcO
MLQRSPTYIVASPARIDKTRWIHRFLPAWLAYRLTRWQSILFGIYFYTLTRRRPEVAKAQLLSQVRQQLGDSYDIETHLAPAYNPWDQRLCVAPDGDFFAAIRAGKVSIVTDQIETFTRQGIKLRSGHDLAADIIVTATGLSMKIMGGVQLVVDDVPVDLARTLIYRGMMYRDVPNLAFAFGYINASWTLKCELIAQRLCRILNYMDRHAYTQCTPRIGDQVVAEEPMLVELTSGYIQRARDMLPRQGSSNPWKMHQNYLRDVWSLCLSPMNDGAMEFTRCASQAQQNVPTGKGMGERA